jgi:hypothetical protein
MPRSSGPHIVDVTSGWSQILSAIPIGSSPIACQVLLLAAFLCLFSACTVDPFLPTKPTPTVSPCPSPVNPHLTVVPAPTPTITQKRYNAVVKQFYAFLGQMQFQQAYGMLSEARRATMSLDEFKKSMQHFLSGACWSVARIVVSQQDKSSHSWNIGVVLECSSCVKNKVVWSYWDFYLVMEHGRIVIASVVIVPTDITG